MKTIKKNRKAKTRNYKESEGSPVAQSSSDDDPVPVTEKENEESFPCGSVI
jgi:hypothetical protein